MSQQEILNWLEGKEWVTSCDILNNLNISRRSMNESLISLVNHNELKKKKDKSKKNGYMYKI